MSTDFDDGGERDEFGLEPYIPDGDAKTSNCDGCARRLRIVDGIHQHNGRPIQMCADAIAKETGRG